MNEEDQDTQMDSYKDEVGSPDASEEIKDMKVEDIKPEEENDHVTDQNSLTSENDDTKPPEETLSRNLAASSSFALDELMDIGTVDQEEQEAQIKEEKEEENETDTNVSQSPDLSNTGSSSPATLVNGTKPAPSARSESSSPAQVQVKDEPLDEEYDHALTSTTAVKDEEEPAKNDLQIGAVFSVPSEKPAQTLPPHMSCFRCNKALVKGQTAYQRKGSSSVFCSTTCLTANMPQKKSVATRVCHYCQKLIHRLQDMVLWPDLLGAVKEFCSQRCITFFKKKITGSTETLCSMCSQFTVSKHEVTLNGICHKLCSDDCFSKFRMSNKLAMSGCAQCGSFFSSKPLLLILHDGNKTLCNKDCLKKYKEKTPINSTCTMCRLPRPLAEMAENTNPDDSVNLFCSTSCVMAHKVQTVSTSGVRLSCDTCSKISVPSYHLAMSDTSIRNFCTLPCVLAFQEKFKKSPAPTVGNVFTKAPSVLHQMAPISPQPVTIPNSSLPRNLTCCQCDVNIQNNPEVMQIENKLVFFCTQNCLLEFKTANAMVNVCEYCKVEKVTKEVRRIGNRDCHFCSDGCKLLHRHDLTKLWGKHCQSCSFCQAGSKKVVTAHYGTSSEEFCSDDCRSKYTMLFCHVAKCDFCTRKGKLKQSLCLLGDAKHFCDLACLLRFCSRVKETQGPLNLKISTPVIANVMSLASPVSSPVSTSDVTSTRSSRTTNSKPTCPPPPPPTKVLKNKALLCKPLVQNKGVSCKAQTVDCQIQTDKNQPDVLIVPVPVPVYVPVPMAMYSQCTPQTLSLPLPLPVPMFLPVAMNNAEKIVQTIQEIKQKIPSDPFEAELILMAEMVAEDTEEKPKEKPPERQTSKTEHGHDDRTSTYSDDLDTEDLTSFLDTWTDSEPGLRTPGRPFVTEKFTPLLDIPVGSPPIVPFTEPQVFSPPPMDLESDQTIETLERWAQMREEAKNRAATPPARYPRKAREKKKRGRKPKNAPRSPEPEETSEAPSPVPDLTLRLKSEYGLDAWKRWVQWRRNQTDVQKLTIGSRPLDLKEDILRCTTAELSMGLCFFITEIKRPSGEPYSPDSLYYLCLGIQQHLFENGRVENIFMDRFYCRFSSDFTKMLGSFKPIVTSSGYVHSRVEEDFLWECKQLGAYSPIVLLNTLLFFCCKYFGFRTVEQHRQLSFAHVMRCTKTDPTNKKTTFLRFYPPVPPPAPLANPSDEPALKKRREEIQDEVLEMIENTENPLRCPVRLYEFYLSKCSESVKQRTNLFYLHPERCCVPNSPLWFSSTPLDDDTMGAMLVRIHSTRELHPRLNGNQGDADEAPPEDDQLYVPEEEDYYSD